MSQLVQEILAATNQARSLQRNPFLDELGGESTLLGHADELTSSPVAGVACIALAAQWETLIDWTAASSFITTAFTGCGHAVLSEVTDAITALPATTSARIAPALLSVLDSNADPARSAYAGDLLVTLATAEAVGWATVTPSILGGDPTTQTWPATEINMRSAFRIALSHPRDSADAETFLRAMSIDPTNAANANFLLGSIAFNGASSATTPDEIDDVLEQAASLFEAAITSDSEHDDARFMSSLTHVIRGVRNRDELGELRDAADSLLVAAGHIIRFGPPGLTSTALPTSTRSAWVQVADLAAHAILAATADRDTTSPYAVLEAAFQAQRFALSVNVGGKIWVDAITDSFIADEALIDAARRIIEREEPGPFADDLGALINRFEELRGTWRLAERQGIQRRTQGKIVTMSPELEANIAKARMFDAITALVVKATEIGTELWEAETAEPEPENEFGPRSRYPTFG